MAESQMNKILIVCMVAVIASIALFTVPAKTDSPSRESEFVYARIRYHMTPEAIFVREVPWHHDYPYGDQMFPTIVAEVTNIKTSATAYEIVDIDSPKLFKYPFAYLCEPGYLQLNAKDVVNLREYLDRGGFLLIDDLRTALYSSQTGTGPE